MSLTLGSIWNKSNNNNNNNINRTPIRPKPTPSVLIKKSEKQDTKSYWEPYMVFISWYAANINDAFYRQNIHILLDLLNGFVQIYHVHIVENML